VTSRQHRTQWASNKLVAQHLQAAGGYAQRQWALVVIFYAALHSAQAALMDSYGEDPQNHSDRWAVLKKHYHQSPGVGAYWRLRKRADGVRYSGFVPLSLSRDWADLQIVEKFIV
jgi:hypothetical protein